MYKSEILHFVVPYKYIWN